MSSDNKKFFRIDDWYLRRKDNGYYLFVGMSEQMDVFYFRRVGEGNVEAFNENDTFDNFDFIEAIDEDDYGAEEIRGEIDTATG